MINRIELKEPKAKEIIEQLDKQYKHRFLKTGENEGLFTFNFFDEYGFEYERDIYVKATKDDKAILIYVNKRSFPRFARFDDLDEWITQHVRDYIEQIEPHITK